MSTTNQILQGKAIKSNILIVEDDLDQMRLLVGLAQDEIKKIADDNNLNNLQKIKIQNVKIITTTNISSLKKAVLMHKNVLLAILDCNIPNTKGGASNDQFVKTNHKITGQHKTVDVVINNLLKTPVTIISSMNRFQKTVTQYYSKQHDLNINFISKKDPLIIQKNIGYYLRQYLK